MFSRMFGKRAAAIATSLAVVVGLIVSPAFAATASEGDTPPAAPLVEPVDTLLVGPGETPVENPVEEPPAPAPVETSAPELVEGPPADEPAVDDPVETPDTDPEETPSTPQPMQRGAATMGIQSLGIQSTGITPESLPSEFVLGQSLDVQFGGVDADRWTMNWDFLSNANLSTSGHLTGYFSRPGDHTLTVNAQEKKVGLFGIVTYKTIASKQYHFTVVPAVLTDSLPDATVGTAYSQTLDATEHPDPNWLSTIDFTLKSGTLPPGLTLNSNGTISGTVTNIPANPTTYTFDVGVRVWVLLAGAHNSAPKTLSITVGYPAPTWNAITLPDATVGVAYPATSVSANGNGWAVGTYTATGLPDGLTLSSDGVITGTPLPNAAYSAIETVSVAFTADNGKTSTTTADLVVKSPPSFVTTSPLPNAVVGTAYAATIETAGPDVTYELVSGPAGMVIDPATGELSGWTPTLEKNVRAEVKISNAAGESTQTFVVKPFAVPSITTTTLLSGIVGDSYSDQVTFDGRNAKIKRVAGKLPNGLTLAKGTAANGGGVISGTPTTPGAFNFTVEVTNASGTVTQNFEIRVHDVPVIHVTKLSRAIVGQFYADTVVFSGFDAQVTIVKDALPGGLTLGTDGTITGATTDTGVTAFTVRVSNPAGSVQHRYRIVSFDVPMFQTTALDHGIVGKAFSQQLVADGHNVRFVVPKKFSLPAGMTLERDGLLHGTPTAAGDYTFNIRALNYAGTTVQSFTLTVTKPAMTLSTNSILRGGTLTVTGTGYVPGDNLELWLHSTPVLLGTTVAAGGTFTKTVTIPASTPAGAHSLVVVGAESGTTTSPVTVRMPATTPSSTAPQGDPVDDSTDGTSDDSTDGTDELAGGSDETTPDEADEELPTLDQPEAAEETAPVAGAFNWGIIAALGALLLAVLLLLAILWRRRRAAEG